MPTIGIFCDLTKAFESLDISILLRKLEVYGIRGESLNWFRTYLNNREQYVTVTRDTNGESHCYNSEKLEVLSGVPTGSILGPLLFLVYINDLVWTFPELSLTLYADDTSILVSSDSHQSLMEMCHNIMTKVYDWFKANCLTLNNKTVFIDFSSGIHPQGNIIVNDLVITQVEETKFLGVIMNKTLSWKSHIKQLSSRLHSAIYAIRSTRYNIDEESSLLTYHSLFMSIVNYGIEFWANDHDLERILVLQKKALRIIYRVGNRTSCRSIFKTKGLHTVVGLYILRLLILVHKNKKDWYPVKEHAYPTRHKNNLIAPIFIKQKSFVYEGKQFYNALPDVYKQYDGLLFKDRISDLLLNISPYKKEEYLTYCINYVT